MFLPKNTMFPSNSIKKRENHTPMDMSTYARENGLTEYFGHKCLELRAQLCNVSGNIPRRLNLVAHGVNPCG